MMSCVHTEALYTQEHETGNNVHWNIMEINYILDATAGKKFSSTL
jgi:hypothetical protein